MGEFGKSTNTATMILISMMFIMLFSPLTQGPSVAALANCKIQAITTTTTCYTFTTPSGAAQLYKAICYIETTAAFTTAATCQVVYTAETSLIIYTITILTAPANGQALGLDADFSAAPSTTITVSLQVTNGGTYNIVGSLDNGI